MSRAPCFTGTPRSGADALRPFEARRDHRRLPRSQSLVSKRNYFSISQPNNCWKSQNEFASHHPNTDAALLARLNQVKDGMSRDVAEYLLSIDFENSGIERMNFLAGRAREGHLTAEESAELDSYLHVGSLLSIMQSKATSSKALRIPRQ